jgi:prepilin-type N-terminal cleavage/methylation domain-containing protein
MTPTQRIAAAAGFTLLETLVAISILTLSVVGPLTAANRALVAARTARDQLTASYLAQEGVEYVRAVRDNAFLAGPGVAWVNFITAIFPCRGSATCTLDPSQPMGAGTGYALVPCSGTCAPLRLTQLSNGTYGYTQQTQSGTTVTPFTRRIQVTPVSGAEEEIVTSTVSWTYHGTVYTVVSKDHLTQWQ